MRVRVLRDGIYNDPRNRAQRAQAGDIIEVAGGWYGLSLVADGYAEPYDASPGPEEMPAAGPSEGQDEPGPEETIPPLLEIRGIGPSMARRLGGMGIWSLPALAQSDPAQLGEALGVSEKKTAAWVEQARALVG